MPLDVNDPRVQILSERYNMTPKSIAYIRSAILEGRYNKYSLINHIAITNKRRREAIEEHKLNKLLSEEQREKLISYTNINITFREGVVEILNRLTEYELRDILH
jgi:hypothetical protein